MFEHCERCMVGTDHASGDNTDRMVNKSQIGRCLARSTPIKKNIGWEATFPGAPEGEISAVFMKRVVFALASGFLSRRGLLPPSAFKDRRVEYLRLSMLNTKTAMGSALGEYLKGSLEALDLGYVSEICSSLNMTLSKMLKQISIIVTQSDNYQNDEALEVFIFRFSYSDSRQESSMTREKRPILYHGVASVRKQIAYAVQRIRALSEFLPALPDGCYTNIKLTYYDPRRGHFNLRGDANRHCVLAHVQPSADDHVEKGEARGCGSAV
ncbi:unnamed protein product [Toxocara canis]|uniref:HORMA domain-containing protein n=1 Tax=Toxocara canis TaxID=6265 RepID=A0A183VAR9_TOXCA|nr:unnamed protein product [Toxocara canis]